MSSTISREHQQRISDATEGLSLAEKELELVLHTVERSDRADKKMIGPLLKAAFEKLEVAKANLAVVLEDFKD